MYVFYMQNVWKSHLENQNTKTFCSHDHRRLFKSCSGEMFKLLWASMWVARAVGSLLLDRLEHLLGAGRAATSTEHNIEVSLLRTAVSSVVIIGLVVSLLALFDSSLADDCGTAGVGWVDADATIREWVAIDVG